VPVRGGAELPDDVAPERRLRDAVGQVAVLEPGPPAAVQSTRRRTRVRVANIENPSWCLDVNANRRRPLSLNSRIHSSASKPRGFQVLYACWYACFPANGRSRNGHDSPPSNLAE
jgi:hypothetical protein